MGKTYDNFSCKLSFNFKEITFIDNCFNHSVHIIALRWLFGNNFLQHSCHSPGVILSIFSFRPCSTVLGEIGEQFSNVRHAILLGFDAKVCHARYLTMDLGTPQLFKGHILMHDRFYNPWTGYTHMRESINHEDKICEGRRINRTTRAVT
ncbi:MAG: hypothetical protein BWX92_01438 [Deltaproteobacteria bacterium ADurb.Bin135]|nr:MAG: hypothetical protein BWX92_01438 [Deltaproteobacteria bacterium ADurb.Bin135]